MVKRLGCGTGWGNITGMVVLTLCLWTGHVNAQTITNDLVALLASHEKIAAAKFHLEAAKQGHLASYKQYYPSISAETSAGHEWNKDPGEDRTSLNGNSVNIVASQMIYDFGLTAATVELASQSLERAGEVVRRVEQEVLSEAMAAVVSLASAQKQVDFAKRSVVNITEQTKVENTKVARGTGYPADVLQAKAQLSGAEARLVRAKGSLAQAEAAYQAIFRKSVGQVPTLTTKAIMLAAPSQIPPLNEAKSLLLTQSSRLKLAKLDREIAGQQVEQTKSGSYYPQVSMEAGQNWLDDRSGVIGRQADTSINMKLSYQFDAGLTALNRVAEAQANLQAAGKLYDDLLVTAEKELVMAWSRLETAKQNYELLKNQADLAEQFLVLARKEREGGRRSLTEVLIGETAHINALSDAELSAAEVLQAQIAVLHLLGSLQPGSLTY